MKELLIIAEVLLLLYAGFSAVYFLIFSAAALFFRQKKGSSSQRKKPKVAVLIPSYREDSVIVESAASAVNHRCNAQFSVVVVADSLQPSTIENLRNTGAEVLEVTFEKSTKSKSVRKALEVLPDNTDYVVILDADNLMAENFIDNIILQAEQGLMVVQGHRTAKNENTAFAFLDGISEEVNNAIFREGHRVLGLSASLIGSGFVCEYNLLKQLMKQATAVGGFDKELEIMLLKRKIRIGYAKNAIVLDEKIQKPDAFVNQRRRWLSAQFTYLKANAGNGIQQLIVHGNVDFFDKVLQFLVLPRILTIGITLMMAMIHLPFIWMGFQVWFLLWLLISGIAVTAVLLAIPLHKYNRTMLKSIISLPQGFLLTFLALLKIKGANKNFIHTAHGLK